MNHTPDRGPRHEDDDYSQNTEQREEPTEDERRESIREALHEKLVADELCNIVIPDLVLTRRQAE